MPGNDESGLFAIMTFNSILMELASWSFGRTLGSERRFRPRLNPTAMMLDEELKQRYRFERRTIELIADKLWDHLEHRSYRNNPTPVYIQVLFALHYLSEGVFFHSVCQMYNVSKSTAQRCLIRFCRAVCRLMKDEIRIPSERSLELVKQSFYEIAGFPNVIGLIDGTLIKIKTPAHRPQDFMTRKRFCALNVYICCGPDNRIYDCSVKFPGSVNDSRVFQDTELRRYLQSKPVGFGVVLGDNGYGIQSYLMTPILYPDSVGHRRYNSSHRKTRVIVEHTLGMLKAR